MAIFMSVLLLFAGIGVLILIHICLVGRTFRRALANTTNDINNGVAQRASLASSSMSRDDIEKLPSFRYKDDIIITNIKEERMMRNIGNPKECAVCLENLKEGDKCRLLPFCKHSFHADCVDVWLLKSTRCPICRTSAESSNRDIHFDEEIGVFQSDEIVIVEESEINNQEISEIQEVHEDHQHHLVIEMREDEPKDYKISGEIISTEVTEDSNDAENQAIKLERV
ncbi:hypothetical protein LIER_43122 [Lithospermum erythrorhizon]|uniref:RING-type domain-containing protein n=1 Tax=Lithospermum erythrorhizon TaxID=34254 RepID=A0AAV3PID5_LITER